jgi:transcriptional regulator with XRE-family HTH domain
MRSDAKLIVEKALESTGLSQAELASLVGKDQSWVSRALHDKIERPDPAVLRKLRQVAKERSVKKIGKRLAILYSREHHRFHSALIRRLSAIVGAGAIDSWGDERLLQQERDQLLDAIDGADAVLLIGLPEPITSTDLRTLLRHEDPDRPSIGVVCHPADVSRIAIRNPRVFLLPQAGVRHTQVDGVLDEITAFIVTAVGTEQHDRPWNRYATGKSRYLSTSIGSPFAEETDNGLREYPEVLLLASAMHHHDPSMFDLVCRELSSSASQESVGRIRFMWAARERLLRPHNARDYLSSLVASNNPYRYWATIERALLALSLGQSDRALRDLVLLAEGEQYVTGSDANIAFAANVLLAVTFLALKDTDSAKGALARIPTSEKVSTSILSYLSIPWFLASLGCRPERHLEKIIKKSIDRTMNRVGAFFHDSSYPYVQIVHDLDRALIDMLRSPAPIIDVMLAEILHAVGETTAQLKRAQQKGGGSIKPRGTLPSGRGVKLEVTKTRLAASRMAGHAFYSRPEASEEAAVIAYTSFAVAKRHQTAIERAVRLWQGSGLLMARFTDLLLDKTDAEHTPPLLQLLANVAKSWPAWAGQDYAAVVAKRLDLLRSILRGQVTAEGPGVTR